MFNLQTWNLASTTHLSKPLTNFIEIHGISCFCMVYPSLSEPETFSFLASQSAGNWRPRPVGRGRNWVSVSEKVSKEFGCVQVDGDRGKCPLKDIDHISKLDHVGPQVWKHPFLDRGPRRAGALRCKCWCFLSLSIPSSWKLLCLLLRLKKVGGCFMSCYGASTFGGLNLQLYQRPLCEDVFWWI
jgi:hypothetical protein